MGLETSLSFGCEPGNVTHLQWCSSLLGGAKHHLSWWLIVNSVDWYYIDWLLTIISEHYWMLISSTHINYNMFLNHAQRWCDACPRSPSFLISFSQWLSHIQWVPCGSDGCPCSSHCHPKSQVPKKRPKLPCTAWATGYRTRHRWYLSRPHFASHALFCENQNVPRTKLTRQCGNPKSTKTCTGWFARLSELNGWQPMKSHAGADTIR